MNLFSHITGFTLIAVLLMSVRLAAQQLIGQTFIFTVNHGDEAIFRIPANCSNGYRFRGDGYNHQLSEGNCSKEEGSPICYTYRVESNSDYSYYYLYNENTGRKCNTSYYIKGPSGQTFMFTVKLWDEVVFRIPANCSNGYKLTQYGETIAELDKLGGYNIASQLSEGNCSKEEGSPICYTYSIEGGYGYGYYTLINKNTGIRCHTSYLLKHPDEQLVILTANIGDEVIFRIPANCLNHLLFKYTDNDYDKLVWSDDKLLGEGYIHLSDRDCSKEEGSPICFTCSVESEFDFGYYYWAGDDFINGSKSCHTTYFIKRPDATFIDADMEESTTITTNTPTTAKQSSSGWAPTFRSINALTNISTSGTTAVQTSITVDILQQLKSGNTTALEALTVLANRTKTATLVKDELHQIESVLEVVINNLTLEVSDLQTVTKDFMEVASNLINKTTTDLWREQLKINNSGAESVINLVDRMVSRLLNVASNDSIQLNFTSPELYVEVVKAVQCQENISFPNRKEVNKESHFAQTMCLEGVNTTSYSGVIYYDIGPLIELPTERGNMSKPVEVSNRKKVQPTIISFTNPEFDGKVLIKIKVDNQQHKDPMCVFLDIRKNMWSDNGCRLVSYDSDAVLCECNHLTNFAVLMSVMDVSVHENTALNVLSIVSCCISMSCLLVTMMIHIVYKRKLTAKNSSKVLLLTVLCGVLIFTYILFLAGITKTDNKVVCTAIAVILHLSLLTVFSLMLAIGIDYFLIVVKPLYTKHLGNHMILASFVCPAVIVGISSAATRLNGYGNDKACWLSMENLAKLAFIIPVCLVVCVNIGIVIMMFKAMFNQSTMKKKSGEEKIRTSIRNIFIMSPVFGFTWIIGIFAVSKETIAYQYIFVILNGLQGVLIMVCHCALNPKVRGVVRSRTYRRKVLLESLNQATNPTVSTKKSELQSTTAV